MASDIRTTFSQRMAAVIGRPNVRVRFTFHKVLLAIWVISLVIGLAIILVPEKRKRPLVARDGWTVEGHFTQNMRPMQGEVSRSIMEDPQTSFWSSWTPNGGAPGQLVSAPFKAPRIFAVPFSGYPEDPEINLYLECIENGNRMRIAFGNAHDRWVERIIWRPTSWCRSKSRLVARSTSQRADLYIAVGTPFRSSRLSWWKESVFTVVLIHGLACLLLLAPGFMVARLVGINDDEVAFVVALPATLLIGYAAFFAFYYGSTLMHFGCLLFIMISISVTFLNFHSISTYLRQNPSAVPIRMFFGLSLSYALFLYSADLGVGSFAANYRFAPVVWSTDNQLSQIVAEAVYRHDPIKSLLGQWHVSDRPPLMSGLFLLGRPVWEPLIAVGENARLLFYFYQVTGIVASTLWVVPVWLLLKSVRASYREASLVVIVLATTGLVVFNSTYIWPKMLSGALALVAYLTHRSVEPDARYHALKGEVAVGLLVALALLAHSGVVFGLVPLFVVSALQRTANRVRGVVLPMAVTAVVITPWLLWQWFEDPPGNALTKFALAGTYGIGEETKGLLETIRDSYSRLSPSEWFLLRYHALLTLFGVFRPPLVRWLWLAPMDFLGQLRLADFAFAFPSMGLGNLAWLILAAARLRVSQDGHLTDIQESQFAWWVIIGLGGVALNVLVLWHVHINWTQSYISLLLMITGLYSALLLKNLSLRRMILAGQFAYFAVVWLWSPLVNIPWRHDHLIGWLASVLGIWLAIPPRSVSVEHDEAVLAGWFSARSRFRKMTSWEDSTNSDTPKPSQPQ